jgi:hypothetical protein
MKTKPFTSGQFTPTKWDSAEQKAKFANHLVRFIRNGFLRSLFHKWFYTRLSMTFGMIAHYNLIGFYSTFFVTKEDQQRFIHMLKSWPCYGDPEWTYSDVEKAVQKYLKGELSPSFLAPRS